MNLESPIKAWRKLHKLSKPQAIAVLGLSEGGYNKQVAGHRPTSEQTHRIMRQFDLMSEDARYEMLADLQMIDKK